ncbi:MAG: DUF4922 domain-containing protein [Deltaproteobacteria bacterium]
MESDAKSIYANFNGRSRQLLQALAEELLEGQQECWPLLRAGYAALDMRRERLLEAGGLVVVLQCNPQRIVSTQANIDIAAIQSRPCFLCHANLPVSQQTIVYRRHFLVLCNPFPIVARHFTIAHRVHRPQSLQGVLPTFLQLARDFHPDYALLYNGPQSGASAPDHLHFQALPWGSMPVLNEGVESTTTLLVKNGVSLGKKIDGVRTAWLVEGTDAQKIVALLRLILQAMQREQSPPPEPPAGFQAGAPLQKSEPMLNLLCRYAERRWRVLIFPRRKHRPDVFYRSGAERIMVSPGAVEMSGVLVLPREEDYNRLDAALLVQIFQEITLGEEMMDEIVRAL